MSNFETSSGNENAKHRKYQQIDEILTPDVKYKYEDVDSEEHQRAIDMPLKGFMESDSNPSDGGSNMSDQNVSSKTGLESPTTAKDKKPLNPSTSSISGIEDENKELQRAISMSLENTTEELASAVQPSNSKDKAEFDDNEQAINFMQQAVELAPGDADSPALLYNLGKNLSYRFERLGELSDLGQAINLMQQTVSLTPEGGAGKPDLLYHLGKNLSYRFERLGELSDLGQAINFMQQAVSLTPAGDAGRPDLLYNLGKNLSYRFERLGDIGDLGQAISLMQHTVNLTPDGDAVKSMLLSDLGKSLSCRFRRLGDPSDFKQAINVMQQALVLTPDGAADKPILLYNLGTNLSHRFECFGDLSDLEQAINFMQQAVALTPDENAGKPTLLFDLGKNLSYRFERLEELSDLDQSIKFMQQAVDLTPKEDADRSFRLSSLGKTFDQRFAHLNDPLDHNHAMSAFRSAAAISGNPPAQLSAVVQWADLAVDSQLAVQAYEQFFELLPRVVWLGQTVDHRFSELVKLGPTIRAAVGNAILTGNLAKAVEWLEEGHGVVWGQILQLRTPLDKLQHYYPGLAAMLQAVSRALQRSGTSPHTQMTHTMLATDYESLIETIRAVDGFEAFLKPKKLPELLPASQSGFVVVVNVDKSHCDAIALSSSADPLHIPLLQLSLQQCQDMHSKLLSSLNPMNVQIDHDGDPFKVKTAHNVSPPGGQNSGSSDFLSILKDLWLTIVQPILYRLDLLQDHPPNVLPHVTWCATGPLAFLPIHAAGMYGPDDSQQKIFDYVVSSYTTTLTALTSRAIPSQSPRSRVLIVSQPATPPVDSLPGTLAEIMAIQTCVPSGLTTHLTGDQATVDNVIGQMGQHEIVHFACPGKQEQEPLDSAFALHDGALTLQKIMSLSFDNVQLAFLSTGQTATGDTRLPEEAVHLAAGMLAVGYPSVIATMWPAGDQEAPTVASEVYTRCYQSEEETEQPEEGPSSAYALHEAVKVLRQRVGETQFEKWVPFVHFGL